MQVNFLSLIPQFAVVTGTLSRAAGAIGAFLVIFLMIAFAFGTAFHMTFGSRLHNYRNLTSTFYTLLQALLGDFNFEELTTEDKLFGPFLFIAFISVAVFVILNVVIAIIGNAYDQTSRGLAEMEDGTMHVFFYICLLNHIRFFWTVKFGESMWDYLVYSIIQHAPVIGKYARRYEIRKRFGMMKQVNGNGKSSEGNDSEKMRSAQLMKKIKLTDSGQVVRGRKISVEQSAHQLLKLRRAVGKIGAANAFSLAGQRKQIVPSADDPGSEPAKKTTNDQQMTPPELMKRMQVLEETVTKKMEALEETMSQKMEVLLAAVVALKPKGQLEALVHAPAGTGLQLQQAAGRSL
jgi:hypothetical protein